jgi:2-iminobutanoate/2-iminopropanoate deaminase
MPSITRVTSPAAPEPPPQKWSNCLVVGGIAYVSGMSGHDANSRSISGDEYEQARVAFRKMAALVVAAGGMAADIVKMTIFVTDISRIGEVQKARAEFFQGDFPASTLVQVAALADPAMKVEIECIAHIGAG